MTIVGVEGLDHIEVTARYYAGARDRDDAELSFPDTHAQTMIELRDGTKSGGCINQDRDDRSVSQANDMIDVNSLE